MNNIQPQVKPHAEREYLHTLSAGALLPFMQASIMAVVVSIVTYAIASLVFNAIDPHKPALLFGALAWLWMLYRLFRHWLTLTAIEQVFNQYFDGDGVIGSSEPVAQKHEASPVIRIQLVKDNGHVSDTLELPCDDEQLSKLAKGLLNGLPFTEFFWTGKGKPFSTNAFRELRDVMMKRGLCEYVNPSQPRQGIRLTDEGKSVMKVFAAPHSPTAESEA